MADAYLPRLRCLRFEYGTWKELRALCRPHLTSLIVEMLQTPQPQLATWLELLRETSSLEILSIKQNCFDRTTPGYLTPVTTTARLPRLRSITLQDDDTTQCAQLLRHIEIPCSCSVELGPGRLRQDGALMEFVLSTFANQARGQGIIGPPGIPCAVTFEWTFYETTITVY